MNLPLKLSSHVELGKFMIMSLICHDRKLRELVEIIIDKWGGNIIENYNGNAILKMWTWIVKLSWKMKLGKDYGKW